MNFSKGQSFGKYFSKVSAILLLVTCMACFIAMYRIIKKGSKLRKKTSLKEHAEKYEIFKEGLGSTSNWITTFWKILIIGRWTITNFILIVVKDHNEFQIVMLLGISIAF